MSLFSEDSAVNLQLRLEALIAAGKDSRTLAIYLSRLLSTLLREGANETAMKEAAHRVTKIKFDKALNIKFFMTLSSLQVFSHFDGKFAVLIELIDQIPWPGSEASHEGKGKTWPSDLQCLHWVLAQFACRCYSSQGRLDELFNLLVETSQWMQFNSGNNH